MKQIATALGVSSQSSVFSLASQGKAFFELGGTFSGNTLTLEVSRNGTTGWETFNADGSDISYAAAGYRLLDLPSGRFFRFATNATGTPSIDVFVGTHSLEVV